MVKTAALSVCEEYRYSLFRRWADGPIINWLALNPSTADAEKDDPTIKREIAFSQAWGFGAMVKTNLFALRATDRDVLKAHHDPVGRENDRYIREACLFAQQTLVAWGSKEWAGIGSRDSWVFHKILGGLTLAHPIQCLGTNKDGSPKHPLYLKGEVRPEPFAWRAW